MISEERQSIIDAVRDSLIERSETDKECERVVNAELTNYLFLYDYVDEDEQLDMEGVMSEMFRGSDLVNSTAFVIINDKDGSYEFGMKNDRHKLN